MGEYCPAIWNRRASLAVWVHATTARRFVQACELAMDGEAKPNGRRIECQSNRDLFAI
jgi:hypothetical protein